MGGVVNPAAKVTDCGLTAGFFVPACKYVGKRDENVPCTNAVVATLLLLSPGVSAVEMVGLLVNATFPLTLRLPDINDEVKLARGV